MKTVTDSPRAGWRTPCWALLLAILTPKPAWAVQVHGPPEGYLVHQMAHLFFSAALVFLLYVLAKRPPGQGRPWRHLTVSLVLFLLWNLDTTAVHWLATRLPEEAITAGATFLGNRLLLPATPLWLFYYLGSFDHLLCVPALAFLAMSLRGLCAEATARQNRGADAP